ncbi:hypothetical protein DASB73_022630 [Starmerella bacillaris]|uniref:Uncharacterized protein n=1 Tax=Starmerella bacillaris TaxID=1247836 RepID=A0AAV5RIN6_STABA|nr:hypothetical protein DASB73_022630 [Starmerella bacillaris]
MDNYDDDFSTLKAHRTFKWRADVPMVDGDATVKQSFNGVEKYEDSIDYDEDFADDFETAISSKKQISREPLPDAFLSDSSSKSFGARSTASSVSASATSVDVDFEDDDFENFEVNHNTLKERFKARESRAANAVKFEADDLDDIDIEQLTQRMKNGTVPQNIKYQAQIQQARAQQQALVQQVQAAQAAQAQAQAQLQQAQLHQHQSALRTSQSSRMLRGMRSVAQFQQQSDTKLRGAMSMMDLNNSKPTKQRPLTAYVEPTRQRKVKTKNSSHNKTRLIRNPQHTLTRQETNGMVLNPQTGQWEGNDADASKFDIEPTKPTLIPVNIVEPPKVNGMIFDKRTLSWVYANEDEYDDPFAEIEVEETRYGPPPQLSKKVRIESATSASSYGRSSVARSETSGEDVFDISIKDIYEWEYHDKRFMRKFGRWIGGEEERRDMLLSDLHFYEMVRNV